MSRVQRTPVTFTDWLNEVMTEAASIALGGGVVLLLWALYSARVGQ